jgi:hypothetical protein
VAYTGRKIRIVPASPFLQLSRVHAVNEVQSAIPRVAPPPLYRQALVPLPLAVQQQMQQAKLVNNSLLNKPDAPNNDEMEEQEERAPVLFLENGTYHAVRVRARMLCVHTILKDYTYFLVRTVFLSFRCGQLLRGEFCLSCVMFVCVLCYVCRHDQSLPTGTHLTASARALHLLGGRGLPGRRLRANRRAGRLLWYTWGSGYGTHR